MTEEIDRIHPPESTAIWVDSILLKIPVDELSDQGRPLVLLVLTRGDNCQAFLAENNSDVHIGTSSPTLLVVTNSSTDLQHPFTISYHGEQFRCVKEYTALVVVANAVDVRLKHQIGAGMSPLSLVDIIFHDTQQQIRDDTVPFNPEQAITQINSEQFLKAVANMNIETQPANHDLMRVTIPVYDNEQSKQLKQLIVFVEHLVNLDGNSAKAEQLPLSRLTMLIQEICAIFYQLTGEQPQLLKLKSAERKIQETVTKPKTLGALVKRVFETNLNDLDPEPLPLESYTLVELKIIAQQLVSLNSPRKMPVAVIQPEIVVQKKAVTESGQTSATTIDPVSYSKYSTAFKELLSQQAANRRRKPDKRAHFLSAYDEELQERESRERSGDSYNHVYYELPLEEMGHHPELHILLTNEAPIITISTRFVQSLAPDTVVLIVKNSNNECRLRKVTTGETSRSALICNNISTEIVIGYGVMPDRGYYEKRVRRLKIRCGGRECRLNLDQTQDESVVVRDLSKAEQIVNQNGLSEFK